MVIKDVMRDVRVERTMHMKVTWRSRHALKRLLSNRMVGPVGAVAARLRGGLGEELREHGDELVFKSKQARRVV